MQLGLMFIGLICVAGLIAYAVNSLRKDVTVDDGRDKETQEKDEDNG